MFKKQQQDQAGYSLVEVMVAIGLSTVLLLGVTSMLKDFTSGFVKADRKNVLVMIRTRVLNELTRKDSWVVTYSNNTSFTCLFQTVQDPACGTGDTRFNVLNSTAKPVLLTTSANPNRGFTLNGEDCILWDEVTPNPACPIRLEVSWSLRSWGDITDFNSGTAYSYTPTNVMPYGYAPTSYFPSWPISSGGYGYFGVVGAQLDVQGTFRVIPSLRNEMNPDKYGFRLLKEVP